MILIGNVQPGAGIFVKIIDRAGRAMGVEVLGCPSRAPARIVVDAAVCVRDS